MRQGRIVVGGRRKTKYIKIARLYHDCPQRQRRKKKIERENSKQGDSRVRQWTASGGGGVTERRRCSQQENREGEKEEKRCCLQSPAVSVGFSGHIVFLMFSPAVKLNFKIDKNVQKRKIKSNQWKTFFFLLCFFFLLYVSVGADQKTMHNRFLHLHPPCGWFSVDSQSASLAHPKQTQLR